MCINTTTMQNISHTWWCQDSFCIIWMLNIDDTEKGAKPDWENIWVLLSPFHYLVHIGPILFKLKEKKYNWNTSQQADFTRCQLCVSVCRMVFSNMVWSALLDGYTCYSCCECVDTVTSRTCPNSQCGGGPGKAWKFRSASLLFANRIVNLYTTAKRQSTTKT